MSPKDGAPPDERARRRGRASPPQGRRVPEAAPVVGLVIAAAVGLFGFLFAPADGYLATVLVAVLPLYAFTAFGIVRADDRVADAIPPDAALAGAFLAAVAVLGYGLAVAGQPAFAVLVGLVVLVPPAMYHARHGEPVNPLSPGATLAVGAAVAAGLVVFGPLVGGGLGDDPGDATLWALDGLLVVLAALDYRDERGGPLARRTERAVVGGSFAGATLAVGYFVVVASAPVAGLLVAGALIAVGAYVAAGRGRERRHGRARR